MSVLDMNCSRQEIPTMNRLRKRSRNRLRGHAASCDRQEEGETDLSKLKNTEEETEKRGLMALCSGEVRRSPFVKEI
jgi:hypothetical protein